MGSGVGGNVATRLPQVSPAGHSVAPGARYKKRVALHAALFDMDRTLLAQDTAWLYTRYRRERGEISLAEVARVAYWTLEYWLGVIDAPRVAERVLKDFAGKREASLIETVEAWFQSHVVGHVRPHARETVERHRAAGDLLVIATSATAYAAWPLARELGIEHVVSSELEVDEKGLFTGRVIEPICYAEGKVTRVLRLAERLGLDLENAAFYSDSINDRPLLERVGNPVVVTPDRRLRRLAQRKGWPVEIW